MELETPLKDGSRLLISHADPSDAAEIVSYVNRVSGESDFLTFGPGELGISVEGETKLIVGLDGGRFNFMLKGVASRQIVALCTLMRQPRPRLRHVGELGLSVARSHWGLGIGKSMCLAMLEVAREVGVTKVDLNVREDNASAIRLYERVGFQREGLRARGLRAGDRYFSNVTMGICLD